MPYHGARSAGVAPRVEAPGSAVRCVGHASGDHRADARWRRARAEDALSAHMRLISEESDGGSVPLAPATICKAPDDTPPPHSADVRAGLWRVLQEILIMASAPPLPQLRQSAYVAAARGALRCWALTHSHNACGSDETESPSASKVPF
jgi:hypothetical protein